MTNGEDLAQALKVTAFYEGVGAALEGGEHTSESLGAIVADDAYQAIVEAIDGPEGCVMVAVPVPENCPECCFNYDWIECKFPYIPERPEVRYVSGAELPYDCPLKVVEG